jgi:hypothetical protein
MYVVAVTKTENENSIRVLETSTHDTGHFKILAFVELTLPALEAEIVYTVLIYHTTNGITTYLFVLGRQHTKDNPC